MFACSARYSTRIVWWLSPITSYTIRILAGAWLRTITMSLKKGFHSAGETLRSWRVKSGGDGYDPLECAHAGKCCRRHPFPNRGKPRLRRTIRQMLTDYNFDGLDELANASSRAAKGPRCHRESPTDGIYRAEGVIEQMEGRENIVIKATVEVSGSDVIVDLAGLRPKWIGAATWSTTLLLLMFTWQSRVSSTPDIPNNHGECSFTSKAPEGKRGQLPLPAAVAARMQIGHFMTEIIYRALSKSPADRVIASSGGNASHDERILRSPQGRLSWHSSVIRGGGGGASSLNDGKQCYIFLQTAPILRRK